MSNVIFSDISRDNRAALTRCRIGGEAGWPGQISVFLAEAELEYNFHFATFQFNERSILKD